jgi:hypothetical protein
VIAPLTADERAALALLAAMPAAPPWVVDDRGIVDEAASDVPRRAALAEIAEIKHRARCLSNAVADVVEAESRGRTLTPYTQRQTIAVADALEAAGLGHMTADAIVTRIRAVEIQTLLRADRAQHAAE